MIFRKRFSIIRLLWKIVLLLIFVFILFIINAVSGLIGNYYLSQILDFLSNNITLIITIWIIDIIGYFFYLLFFPVYFVSPVIYAINSFFIVKFIFNVLAFIANLSGLFVITNFIQGLPQDLISILIFIAVLIAGYADIFQKDK